MELINSSDIQTKIYTIRDTQVMLDSDLAKLYQVETKHVNQAVRNNKDKFLEDFYFQLSDEEFVILRSNNLTTKFSKTRVNPKVFTEQGVYMLATIIKSKVASDVTVKIIRTFTKLREFALNYKDVINRVEELEKNIKITGQQTNYNTEKIDEAFILLNEILKDTQKTNKNLIGFERKEDN